jgi:hypothetical protein
VHVKRRHSRLPWLRRTILNTRSKTPPSKERKPTAITLPNGRRWNRFVLAN